jgi:hypothetical protein
MGVCVTVSELLIFFVEGAFAVDVAADVMALSLQDLLVRWQSLL